MGGILWIGKLIAKLAILFAKFDSMGLFDALSMLFGELSEDNEGATEAVTPAE